MDTHKYSIIEGLPFVSITFPANKHDAIYLDDNNIEKASEYIQKHNVNKISCEITNFNCLENFKQTEHLSIGFKVSDLKNYIFVNNAYTNKIKELVANNTLTPVNNDNYECYHDIDSVYKLKLLKSIGIFESGLPSIIDKASLDISKFGYLEKINCEHRFIRNIEDATALKSFLVSYYKPKSKSLIELNKLQALDTIYLLFPNINNLNGLENFPNLSYLSISNSKSLNTIDSLANASKAIYSLKIENCPKITDFSALESLENLQLLFLSGSNTLHNLRFLKKLKNIKRFILNMNVADGDLSLCDFIEDVHIVKNRKHFNRKNEQLPKAAKCFMKPHNILDDWRRLE